MDISNAQRRQRRLATWIALAALFWAPVAHATRIVALGDVHGSYENLEAILKTAGLIDEDLAWSGGDAVLVQTGDLLDRGIEVRRVLDLLIDLEPQAEAAGGRIVALLGNHEVNNLVGYRDGVPMEGTSPVPVYATFAGDEAEELRKSALKRWNRWQRRYPGCSSPSREEWLLAHPPGYLEYVASLAPTGKYGRWIREHRTAVEIDGTVFLHGGLSPDLSELFGVDTVDELNERVAAELAQWDADRAYLEEQDVVLPFTELGELFCAVQREADEFANKRNGAAAAHHQKIEEIRARLPTASSWISFSGEGPLWFRGYARWTDAEGPALLDEVADTFGAERFVVGHTPQTTGIVSRFDRRLFLIDTAMVFGAAAGGRPAVLELVNDEVYAVYRDERVALRTDETPTPSSVPMAEPIETPAEGSAATRWLGPDGRVLPFETPEEVRDFLAEARIVSVEDIPTGVTKPKRLQLDLDGAESRAAFRYVDIDETRRRLSTGKMVMYFRDSYVNEVAAYELSRMLGLDNVPPAVVREVENQIGSVQMWVENAMMDSERRAGGHKPPNQLRFNRQFYDMRVFDNLINNVDRNQGNILYDSQWKLWMIDHTRSFARDNRLPAPNDVLQCSRSLWKALRELDEEEVEGRLSPYLSAPEVRALLRRREALIALIEKKIVSEGEDRVLFDYGAPHRGVAVSYEEADVPPAADDG